MVRPNHDLPAVVVGGVKDFADRNGMSPEEAHEKLLRQALYKNDVRIDDED